MVAKYAAVAPVLDERSRRVWAATEAVALGYGGDALVSAATGLARATIRKGRQELARGGPSVDRMRRPGAGRPSHRQRAALREALEALVDPLTRGDPTSPLRWTCKSRAKLAAALGAPGLACQLDDGGPHAQGRGLQSAGAAQAVRRYAAPRPQRPIRIHQCDRRTVPAARLAGHLGRHQEEGIGRELQERAARMAAEGRAGVRARARFPGGFVRQGDSLRRL